MKTVTTLFNIKNQRTKVDFDFELYKCETAVLLGYNFVADGDKANLFPFQPFHITVNALGKTLVPVLDPMQTTPNKTSFLSTINHADKYEAFTLKKGISEKVMIEYSDEIWDKMKNDISGDVFDMNKTTLQMELVFLIQ